MSVAYLPQTIQDCVRQSDLASLTVTQYSHGYKHYNHYYNNKTIPVDNKLAVSNKLKSNSNGMKSDPYCVERANYRHGKYHDGIYTYQNGEIDSGQELRADLLAGDQLLSDNDQILFEKQVLGSNSQPKGELQSGLEMWHGDEMRTGFKPQPSPVIPQRPNRPRQEGSLGLSYWNAWLSYLAIAWFWTTVLSTFYCGTVFILPVLYSLDTTVSTGDVLEEKNYDKTSSFLLLINKMTACVMLFEMIVNWACVRYIESSFRLQQHFRYIIAHAKEISSGGFEINLNHLRAKPSPTFGHGSASSFNHETNNSKYLSSSSYSLPLSSVRSLDQSNPHKRWTHGTMYIVSLEEPPPSGYDVRHGINGYCNDDVVPSQHGIPAVRRQIVYPYWAWKPCHSCPRSSSNISLSAARAATSSAGQMGVKEVVSTLGVMRPPRTHHCHLCGYCVLKRDHHCFFTGRCVGVRNQRHFVVFAFWSTITIAYSLVHSVAYVFTHYLPRNTVWDLFPPLTVIRWWLGRVSALDTVLPFVFYSLLWFFVTAGGLLLEQWRIIGRGVTSFESDNAIKVTNRRSRSENVRGVFGRYWAANFLIPLHWVFPATDDGLDWSEIEM